MTSRAAVLERMIGDPSQLDPQRMGAVCIDVTATDGAGITLFADGVPQGHLAATNPISALIEELQFDLGEGPCVDAFRLGRPIMEPDLAQPAERRWVAFSGAALEAGVAAIFGFPLLIGDSRLGAMDLYRHRPGRLTDGQRTDALLLAGIVARRILLAQALAPLGTLAPEVGDQADLRLAVHQAAGMVSAQLGVTIAEAMTRLRAHAFGSGRTLQEVAEDVVGRRLRLDEG